MHNFKELKIWRIGMDIAVKVYLLSRKLPDDERFGMVSQIRRCSVSIPSNLAEGSGRGTSKDFNRFIDYSLSSSYELETQLLLTQEIYEVTDTSLFEKISEFQRMTIGFKKTLAN
jgi:four helix bundle protein